MGSVEEPLASGNGAEGSQPQKQILLNAFDMSTVGHLSPGQWKVRKSLENLFEIALNELLISTLGPQGQIYNKEKARLLDRSGEDSRAWAD
jgi:hypothetical protein